MSELAAKDAFIDALDDRELMIKVCEQEPGTLDQAFKIAERMELYQKIPSGKETEFKTKQPSKVRATAAEDDSLLKSVVETQRLMQKQLALLSESIAKDRTSNKKPDDIKKAPETKAKGRCHNCHELGHYRFECPTLVKQPTGTSNAGDATTRTIASGGSQNRLTVTKGPNRMSPSVQKTVTWKRSTPSESWKNNSWSTQPAQRLQHTQQLPEVHPNWSTQHAPQTTQHTQQLPEVHPSQTTQQSTQHAQQSTQHSQHEQGTFQHVVEAELLPQGNPEVSSPGNKSCKTGNTLFIEVKIGKRRCPALLDTGLKVTLFPKHLADLSQLNRSSRTLRAANGTLINIVGEWKTVVTIGPVSVTMNFIVSDQIDELLVGIDWMRNNGCVISFADLTLELQGYRFPLLAKTKSGSCNRVILEEGVILPAKSEAMVSGKVVYADLHKRLPAVGITGNKECVPGVKTARCLLELGSGIHLPLRVLNVTNRSVSLQKGMTLCPLQEVESVIEDQKRR